MALRLKAKLRDRTNNQNSGGSIMNTRMILHLQIRAMIVAMTKTVARKRLAMLLPVICVNDNI